jgi:hypothetical protein
LAGHRVGPVQFLYGVRPLYVRPEIRFTEMAYTDVGAALFYLFLNLIHLLGFVPERCGGLEADLEEIRYLYKSQSGSS